MSQVKDLAEQVIVAVKGYIAKSLADLTAQFETKLAAIPVPLKGDPGEPGKNAEVTEEQLATAVTKYLAEHPIPVPQDGKSVTADEVLPQLNIQLTKAVESLPRPENGKDGRNAYEVAKSLGFDGDVYAWLDSLKGEPGKPGDNGKSVTIDDVLPELLADVQKAIAALPLPKDGKDGKDSTVTAEDFRTEFQAESAKALLDFERRAQDVLQKAIDRIEPPKNGLDGFGFDDMEVIHDGERTLTLRFVRDDRVKEFPVKLPVPIDRGVYKSEQKYERGDSVSFGGSIWIAQRDTQSKPETDDSWRLSVKRGRDGKNGDRGLKGDPGQPGKNGKDLTQLGHDGTKW